MITDNGDGTVTVEAFSFNMNQIGSLAKDKRYCELYTLRKKSTGDKMIKSITVMDQETSECFIYTEKHSTYDSVFLCKNCNLTTIIPLIGEKCCCCGVKVIDVERGVE